MTDLCNAADIEARLGRSLTSDENVVAATAISDVSAWLWAVAPTVPDPVPADVTGVAARLSMKVILADPESADVTYEGLGGYVMQRKVEALALSAVDKAIMRPWLRHRGVGSVQIDPFTVVVG